jgi:biotin-dependent carboxylase-like uncharacterized protein
MIRVLRPGPLATVQDLGRPGYGPWGIGPGGAADRGSFTLANRLVGNPEGAAAIEITLGGFRAEVTRWTLAAVTGASATVTVAGRPAGMNGPFAIRPHAIVAIGPPAHGVRSYLAVRGGIDTPPVLGSRATDLGAGLGPGVLRPGTELPIGDAAERDPAVDLAPVGGWPDPVVVPATVGPRGDWFTPGARATLATTSYVVQPASDRVAIRLGGAPLLRQVPDELLSEPAVRGAIEVPPDGQPILFLADHPTTSGYPVIAVADPHGADLAAQLRPGQPVRFSIAPADPV